MTPFRILAVGAVALCGALALAGATKPGAATAPVRGGAAIYNDKCIYCHDTRGWATRVLARRAPPGEARLVDRIYLPADYTKQVVRRGVGSMPGFTPTDLSDAEIGEVAKWLAAGKGRK